MRDNNAIQIISFALAAVKWIPLYIAAIIVTLKVAVAVEKPKCDKKRDKVALFAIFWPVCVPAYIVCLPFFGIHAVCMLIFDVAKDIEDIIVQKKTEPKSPGFITSGRAAWKLAYWVDFDGKKEVCISLKTFEMELKGKVKSLRNIEGTSDFGGITYMKKIAPHEYLIAYYHGAEIILLTDNYGFPY